jgi:hypothetical protein
MERERTLEQLLASYPRLRSPLPPDHARTYVEHYRSNRSGKNGLSRIVLWLESWMHRVVARGVPDGNLLEIGAGNLNHLSYHPAARAYDAVEPFRDLWQESPQRDRVRAMYDDIMDVEERPGYDCIISVAVLEHLTDLPFILARSALLLREGGSMRAGFPSEGGLLWGLAWRLTTGLKYRWDRGLDYGVIMRHEHVNTAAEILELIHYFYERVEVARFPLPLAHLSFYTAVIARSPRLDYCRVLCAKRLETQRPAEGEAIA